MKKVVSVSLGSSARDHAVQLTLWGEIFEVSRRGLDGQFKAAQALLRELDGQVDAFGLGGVDIYLRCREQRYALRDGLRLAACAEKTPVVDGSGLKDTLETQVVERAGLQLRGARVLLVSALDRFGLAQSLLDAGAEVTFGDKIFALNLDQPMTSLDELEREAARLLPELVKLPISMLYPVGPSQTRIEPTPLTDHYFSQADWICGDFHLIRRRLSGSLQGKCILTNTLTSHDVELLRELGVRQVVTSTPEFSGRSFGTNVLEAVLVAHLGAARESDYLRLLGELDWQPRVLELTA
jgi:hypothetical protein